MTEEKLYPINGYAPGNYMCNCISCNTEFMGDKLAVTCKSCAFEAAYIFLTTVAQGLMEELEIERMRHAACGVIAMSNTRKSLDNNKQMKPEYMSASVQDCIDAAEREIKLLEALEEAKKMETIAKLFAKCMFYENWKIETPNERVIEMLMREVGLWPFQNEDDMIVKTQVDEELYKKATKVPIQPDNTNSE